MKRWLCGLLGHEWVAVPGWTGPSSFQSSRLHHFPPVVHCPRCGDERLPPTYAEFYE